LFFDTTNIGFYGVQEMPKKGGYRKWGYNTLILKEKKQEP